MVMYHEIIIFTPIFAL